jgi:hypothetical protein
MRQRLDSHSSEMMLRVVGSIIPTIPLFTFRLLRGYLRFKTSADKAGKIFRTELLSEGICPEFAEDLTRNYLESRSLFTFISL